MDHSDTGASTAENQIMEAKIHYHICWSDSSLDWKAFPTKEEANYLAGKIKKPNESYVIVKRGHDCERCQLLKPKANVA